MHTFDVAEYAGWVVYPHEMGFRILTRIWGVPFGGKWASIWILREDAATVEDALELARGLLIAEQLTGDRDLRVSWQHGPAPTPDLTVKPLEIR